MDAAAVAAALELLAAYRVTLQPAIGSQAQAPGLAALGFVRFRASGLNGTATLGRLRLDVETLEC